MKLLKYGMCIFVLVMPSVFAMETGDEKKSGSNIEVYSEHAGRYLGPDSFFEIEKVERLQQFGTTDYGTIKGDQYPEYSSVREWDFLTERLSDGSHCVMVFFHSRWRRFGDVLALSDQLRDWGGCARVFN